MAGAAKLYTPEVLALATSLAGYPFDAAMPLTGSARSASCGSTLAMSLRLDAEGRIAALGLRPQACAIGQAAAAIFAGAARGHNAQSIAHAKGQLDRWLAGEAELPDWPGMALLTAAKDYPGRHGAIRLAWLAAGELLP